MIEIQQAQRDTTVLKNAYDDLYTVSSTEQPVSYYDWILRKLNPKAGSVLLDVCCGSGKLAERAIQRQVAAIATDFSAVAVHQASGPACISDAMQLPFRDNAFDYVVNLGSLEHLLDMGAGIREMARVLHPNGQCCLLVPNLFGLLWTVRYARFTGELYEDHQPLQRYGTRGEWERLLLANGLHPQRVIGYELPPPDSLRMWLEYGRAFWMKLLPHMVARFIPVNIASMLVFFCTKASR